MRRLAVPLLALTLAGCDDVTSQPKQNDYSNAAVAPGPVTAGTVTFEEAPVPPPPVTLALLQRGQERFGIYCTPCHSELGDGRGMIVQRGFSPPPSYHTATLRQAPPQHFYDVITHGYGAMYSFAARVAPPDRWAIAAYIRALQASQDTDVASLDADQRKSLP